MSGLFGGKPQNTSEPKLNAIQVTQSAYGACIPLVYGKTRVPGGLIWYNNFVATPHTQSQGGKGGGGSQSTSYTYSAALMLMLAEGPITGLGTIWNDKEQKSLSELNMSLFSGAGGQATWSYLTSNFSAQAIPYDHTAFVASSAFDLGNSAGMPNLTFEVKGLLPYNAGTIDDAEPSAILLDYCSDANHGCGFPYLDAGIQGAGVLTYQSYCIAMGFFLSPAEKTQREARSFLNEILTVTNSAIFDSAGTFKITPYADQSVTGNGRTYTPDLTPLFSFTDDDYIYDEGQDPVRLQPSPSDKIYNRFRIEFPNRANAYNTEPAEATDANDIALNGERTAPSLRFDCIPTVAIARQVGQLIMQKQLFYVRQYEFKVRADYCLLEPMDIVSLNDSTLGLANVVCRVLQVEDSEDDELTLLVEELLVGPGSAPVYSWDSAAGYAANFNFAPGNVTTPLLFMAPQNLITSGADAELWCAVGGGSAWGGAYVYMSLDNSTYKLVGAVSGPARYGSLRATLPSVADPDTSSTLQLQLLNTALTMAAGSTADADNLRTLLYVDGEFMSYRDATLVGAGQYNLGYLRRAKYGSAQASHANGTAWARLDSAILRIPIDAGMMGQTVYLKFASFNTVGKAVQSLASVTAYSKTLSAAPTFAPGGELKTIGAVQIADDVIYKLSNGASAWDASAYSVDGYMDGAQVTFRANQTNLDFAIGLTASPAASSSYPMDFSIIPRIAGTYDIWENGSAVLAAIGTYTPATVFQIKYDGVLVRYLVDGVVKRSVPLSSAKLFLDSSFFSPGAAATLVSYGPATSIKMQGWTPVYTNGSGVTMSMTADGTIRKDGGAGSWDSSVHSVESYLNGCAVSFKANQTNCYFMVGLNTDPATDGNYTSIDFAWYCQGDGTLYIYEDGNPINIGSPSYTASTILAIEYDGVTVRYLKDGALIRAVKKSGLKLYLDSSFATTTAEAKILHFGTASGTQIVGGNMLNPSTWRVGTGGTQGNFVNNYDGTNNESNIVLGVGPYGETEPLWQCQSISPSAGVREADGGWDNVLDCYGIDAAKTYRATLWVKRTGTASGNFYLGCDYATTNDLSGSANTNPYFVAPLLSSISADKWYLMVGFIHGSGHGTTADGVGGVYDPETGFRALSANEFKNIAGATLQRHRAYLYYCLDSGTRLYFAKPRFEEVNGNELSILAMLNRAGTGMIPPDAATTLVSAVLNDTYTATASEFAQESAGGISYTNPTAETQSIELSYSALIKVESTNAGASADTPLIWVSTTGSGGTVAYGDDNKVLSNDAATVNTIKYFRKAFVTVITVAAGATASAYLRYTMNSTISAGQINAVCDGWIRFAVVKR